MIEFHISKDYIAVVDDEDADLASLRWTANIDKNTVYAKRTVRCDSTNSGGTTVRLHRLVMERMLDRKLLSNELVDHIDGNGLNNTRRNLRLASSAENSWNSGPRKNNASGYKGVAWHKKDRKWHARITVNGKSKYLGGFDSPEAANEAYKTAAARLHGAFVYSD